MSTTAIVLIAVVALLAWCALLDAVKASLAIRAKASACPCRDLHSMTVTPGSTFELPAGTVLSSGDFDRKVVSVTEVPIDFRIGDTNFRTSISTKGTEEVRKAFADVAGRLNLKKGH
jgi:hypothetical protein